MKPLPIFACLLSLGALPAQSPESQEPQKPMVTKLAAPVASQRTTVVFDTPRKDGPLWACGSAWKASFDGTGATVIPFFGSEAPRNFPLRLEVGAATVGSEALPMVAGKPETKGNAVHTARGAFTEVIDTRMDSLEQSFVFDRLPNRGAITVDVRMSGEFATMAIENGLRFRNEWGHVDYTKAIAVDAEGRRLPLAIEWTGAAARMVIPASFVETATLPLVLDPTLNFWFALGNPGLLQHDGDAATIQAPGINGRTLLVWQRQWSATDQDCWGLMFDNDLNLVLTDFSIDFTAEDWLKVAVAGNNYASNFLVVSEVRIGLLWFIAGRIVNTSGIPGTQFDIEREGVVGTPGNNFHPDVGSDPYFGVGRYTVVFNKKTLGVSDIYMRQITPAGGQVTTNAVALDLSANEESRPAISKSCGQSNGLPAHWLVTWQRTWSGAPFDQEVHGIFVDWNGAVIGAVFGLATTVGEETAPSPASPIDANGVRYWPMCYELASAPGQPRDVLGRLVRVNGTFQQSFTVSGGVPGSDDREPEMDSDGIRFLAAITTGTAGFPQGVEAVTFAYLPTINTIRTESRDGMNTSGAENYGQCNVVAEFSGGSTPTSRYKVCFTEQTPNTLRLANYGGYTSGSFFQQRSTQCGNLSITATGQPILGQTVTISVPNGSLSGTMGGFPINASLLFALGCNCTLGVDPIAFFPNPFVYAIPADPLLVGATFAVQGFTLVGSSCLGSVDFSDTIDFTIR